MLQNTICRILTAILIGLTTAEVSAYTSPDGKISADVENGNGHKWEISILDRLPESLTVQPRGGFVIKMQKSNLQTDK